MTAPLPLDIAPQSIAAATLERHRRLAVRSGADLAVVDSAAYRATLARAVAVDVAPFVWGPV
jgi:hypothetical protein